MFKKMNDKTLSFIVGIISSSAAFEFWNNVITAMAVAFVGGLVTWGTREFLDYCKTKWKKHKKLR